MWVRKRERDRESEQRHIMSTHIAVPLKVKCDNEGATFTISLYIILYYISPYRTFENKKNKEESTKYAKHDRETD